MAINNSGKTGTANPKGIAFLDHSEKNILFEFHKHEFPESIPWVYETKLNKIQYPDGHWTNQIIGTYLQEIEFKGKFFGTYFADGKLYSAKLRSDKIEQLMNKPIVVQFKIDNDSAGMKAVVVIEKYERNVINYYDIDYTIKLVPHEEQTRVVPGKVANIAVRDSILKIIAIEDNAPGKPGKSGKGGKGGKGGKEKPKKLTDAEIERRAREFNSRFGEDWKEHMADGIKEFGTNMMNSIRKRLEGLGK